MAWLCFNNSFFSIVEAEGSPDYLLVRARRSGDIERVFHVRAEVTPGKDYRFRCRLKRTEVARVVARKLESTSYSNFKNSCADHDLHAAYERIWSIMGKLQPGGPFGWHTPETVIEEVIPPADLDLDRPRRSKPKPKRGSKAWLAAVANHQPTFVLGQSQSSTVKWSNKVEA